MVNEDCVKEFMMYLRDNMCRDSRGKIKPIKMRQVLAGALSEKYSSNEIYDAFDFCYKHRFFSVEPLQIPHIPKSVKTPYERITKTTYTVKTVSPENDTRGPRHQHIIGINIAGERFIESTKDISFWEKIKKSNCLEKLGELLALGKSAADLFQLFL